MARILVADDNSNIQKMVGLALKDQGIDVVAVGNGEAAVRKISDIHPDLVLADVFMPVRNGYEVCQYVKGDSSLAHIPVILLVGAFDPLDEQEAQRVGADGVLKKPFVPPEPLISMVKSALAQAGVIVGAAPPAPPREEAPKHVAEMLAPRPAPSVSTLAPVEEFPSVESEPVLTGMPGRPEPVRIDAGSQPLAFGSLLETPETEQEEDLGYATTARPELERDWSGGDKENDVVEEEEEEKSASWRRDAGGESMEEEEPAAAEPVKDWREAAFSEAPARKMKDDSWAPQKEISGFEEAAETEQSVIATVKDAPTAGARVTTPPLAPLPKAARGAPLGHQTGVEAATMEAPAARRAGFPAKTPVEVPVSAPVNVAAAPEPAKPAAASPWFSAVASPWDAEVEKAAQLASTWDAPRTSAPPRSSSPAEPISETAQAEVHGAKPKEDPAATVDGLVPDLSAEVKVKVEQAALPAATVEALREEAHQLAETAVQQAPAAASSSKAPESSMEDMVAKVLSKMSPEMLQAVTREILKPVVEAMVRDEMNAKKP